MEYELLLHIFGEPDSREHTVTQLRNHFIALIEAITDRDWMVAEGSIVREFLFFDLPTYQAPP